MKIFLLFLGGLTALLVSLTVLGPMILLGVCVWLLYIVFKQFMKTNSTLGKIAWIVIGLIILSMALSNTYAVFGLVAIYALYKLFPKCCKEVKNPRENDPFTNFESEWSDLNQKPY